jgi:tetratricopeptide (TPR) repeat protein
MELAKAYLEKFPSGKYAPYLKDKWIPGMYPFFFNKAVEAKNVAEIIRIGKEVLARDADNLDFLSALVVQIRTLELFANPPNFSHDAEDAEFAERAIRLIEGGKTPTGADPTKFNKNVTLAYLHQTLAVIYEHDKNVDKALAEYDKAAQLDTSNPTFFFHCGRIHNDKYAAGAVKYDAAQKKSEDLQKKVQAIPEADRTAATKPEVKSLLADAKTAQDEEKAALALVNGEADAVIGCWARFLGLTAEKNPWGATRDQIQKAFTDLYKYRHNDSTDGLQKLIDQNRPSPAGSNGAAAASAAPKP